MVTRITLSGECFDCAQIKDKMKKKIYYISYLREPRKRPEEKERMCLLNFQDNEIKGSLQLWVLLFLTTSPDFASKRRLKSKLDNTLYRKLKKKRTFECAGRFSDFFYSKILRKEAESREEKKKKTGRLPFILSYIIFILFIISVVFQNISVFVNLYCLNFLKHWENKKSFHCVEL